LLKILQKKFGIPCEKRVDFAHGLEAHEDAAGSFRDCLIVIIDFLDGHILQAPGNLIFFQSIAFSLVRTKQLDEGFVIDEGAFGVDEGFDDLLLDGRHELAVVFGLDLQRLTDIVYVFVFEPNQLFEKHIFEDGFCDFEVENRMIDVKFA
jgi:hypothetical protein